ncbi:MAG TPA: hypothetical protein PKG54_01830 [Phycisphaerae bacterium]|jgi:hypothetical protein|nr:hypothetical protein [Phycisphaerae bacterium]HOB73241.1 hypothetical protein [Phycisphaerae bacterium]HOJ54875.1 hypothetical protein [Phycisphaerae bacterium]HOL26061.1 hypothetical protein [Phycisphaerae bacterium]HPP21515.1 hypothetical protein [Phycisphaerae bacterium]
MATEVKPGQWVNVKVVSRPRAAARIKTLTRLFMQDPAVKKERARKSKSRPIGEHRRGGRMWKDRPIQLASAPITPGATYRIFASVDVLKDLKSVASNVEVTPAQ